MSAHKAIAGHLLDLHMIYWPRYFALDEQVPRMLDDEVIRSECEFLILTAPKKWGRLSKSLHITPDRPRLNKNKKQSPSSTRAQPKKNSGWSSVTVF